MNTLALYLVTAIIAWSPVKGHRYTGAKDADTEARYASIAQDLAEVVEEPEEDPLFEGETGRAQTALVALAIASYESGGFRADVDQFDHASGDGGAAWCLGQVHLRETEPRPQSRKDCWRLQLSRMRESWAMCRGLRGSPADRLTGYTVGSCVPGEPQARRRFERAQVYWARHPYPRPPS